MTFLPLWTSTHLELQLVCNILDVLNHLKWPIKLQSQLAATMDAQQRDRPVK
jgi:hypothetical protein